MSKSKTMPVRNVSFGLPRVTHDLQVSMTISYEIESKSGTTYVDQPVTFSLCEMRWLGEAFHTEVMDSLSKKWHEANKALRGEL